MSQGDPVAKAACLNCGAEIHGTFCSVCGQAAGPAVVPLREWLAEAITEFVDFDGRAVRTFCLLFGTPGALTNEWMAGHKVRFTSPMRVYLVASAFFFTASALPGTDVGAVAGVTGIWFGTASEGSEALSLALPIAVIVLLPLFALVVMLTTRPTRPFLAHLVFTIHAQAVVFTGWGLMILLTLGGLQAWPVIPFAQLTLFVGAVLHVLFSLKRAYSIPLWRAAISLYFVMQANVAVADYALYLVPNAS